MANTNAPKGFKPVRYSDGKPYMGAVNKYYKGTTSGILAVGDPVVRITGSTDPLGVGPEIQQATTGSYITGVVVGFDPKVADLTQVGYMKAADVGYVYVADEPDLIFEVQEGGSGTALAFTNLGQCVDSIAFVTGSTVIGLSKMQIDNATVSTASTKTWNLQGFVQRADNEIGSYAKWLVKPNLHTETVSGATAVKAI
jgi:hypothetical protein